MNIEELEVGDSVFEREMGPITRTTLALFAGASNDHNPIHIDTDAAAKAGLDDVIAHGMLSMAYVASALSGAIDQRKILNLSTRFAAITHVNDMITCSGKLEEIEEFDGASIYHLGLLAVDQNGEVKLSGRASVKA